MKKYRVPAALLLLLMAAVLFLYGRSKTASESTQEERTVEAISMFSWDEEYMLPENRTLAAELLARLDCQAIYQVIPDEIEEEDLKAFTEECRAAGSEVYGLAGDRLWGLEADGASMLAQVDKIGNWNRRLGEKAIKGLVLDVEPYLTDEWKADEPAAMELFVTNCVRAYEKAVKEGLVMIVCIPYHYDDRGMVEQLERLIAEGCDAVAVMNYDKDDEAGQIRNEEYLTRKHGRKLFHITELQKPGYHGLEEQNTYYYDGLEAVLESWERLRAAFPKSELGFSYHYLNVVRELADR